VLACRALLYLPPYSPDLNPIELVFSKLKRLLRDAAERTVEALWQTIGRLLDRFTPNECQNYIRHRGFTQSGPQGSRRIFRAELRHRNQGEAVHPAGEILGRLPAWPDGEGS
jgi:hypothetical protein